MCKIKDVAREAGVSMATVSHVINDSRFVSDEAGARVMAAIERCDYFPNAHARSLASGRSNIIGLAISWIPNPFCPELVKSTEEAAFKHNFDHLLLNKRYEPVSLSKSNASALFGFKRIASFKAFRTFSFLPIL